MSLFVKGPSVSSFSFVLSITKVMQATLCNCDLPICLPSYEKKKKIGEKRRLGITGFFLCTQATRGNDDLRNSGSRHYHLYIHRNFVHSLLVFSSLLGDRY